jgi:predicted nucleic-acid-binding protein
MIAVDANVLVRLLTRDDADQFARAERCLRENDVFVPDTVLFETVWVLISAYSFERAQIASALRRLLGLATVAVSSIERVALALAAYEQGLDFADARHLAGSQDAAALATFDLEFVRRASGLGRCPVAEVE